MSKQVKILNRKLCWHDGVRILWRRENSESWAMEADFEPCRNHSEKSIGSNCEFSCHCQRRRRVLCKRVDTSHGNANNSSLGEDGEIGEVFEKQTQSSVLVQISRNAVPT